MGICLPMQGIQVPSLVREDSTCHGAIKPVHHSYWGSVLKSPQAPATESLPRVHGPHKRSLHKKPTTPEAWCSSAPSNLLIFGYSNEWLGKPFLKKPQIETEIGRLRRERQFNQMNQCWVSQVTLSSLMALNITYDLVTSKYILSLNLFPKTYSTACMTLLLNVC